MERSTEIRLCGPLRIERAGRQVALPGRQGRLVLAYLVLNRRRAVGRDELIDLLWPDQPPADPGEALTALLSRLRRALGAELLPSGRQVELALPEDAWIDLEAASEALGRADGAPSPAAAAEAADACLEIVGCGFLTGDEAPWVDERRRDVEALRLRALEVLAGAGAELGGARLAAAEEAARTLVEAAPFRESGHRLLMGALAARGDVAEALRVYDELRLRLREELGTAPGPEVQALHRRLLGPLPSEDPAPAATAAAPPQERKLVTVLSIALAAAERALDPEDLRTALNEAHERVREVAEAFGGRADRAVAVFGVPVAHEDDAERAVMAALRLRELGVAARAGIATGEAIVSPDGAVGGVSAAAAALERAAGDGIIAVDEATHRASRHAVDYGPGRVVRRGRPERSGEPGRRTRLVGRRHELEALHAQHTAVVAERRPRLLTILGQAGIGKTRLLDEFVDGVECATLRGRCLPYGEGITYWALRELLWQAAAISLPDNAAEAAAKLDRTVDDLLAGADVERVTSALAASAGIALPGGALAGLSPETLADEIALAWPRFLSALALRSPVVVAIEDLHWADAPLVDMVQAILTRSEGPLLLVATARPELAEAHAGWGYRPGMSQLALEPLSRRESEELVGELLPGADRALAARVVASAEGNPFYTQELVRHLVEAGLTEPALPNTVRAVLTARIDALAPAEKRLLQHAAVVGRAFWPEALRGMPTGEPEPALLRSLEERGLVAARPSSALPGHREVWFAHGLTREVAYRSLPRADRCLAHAAVARWLRERAGDRREEFIELLAHHLEAAVAPADARLAWPAGSAEYGELRAGAVRALVEAGTAAQRRLATEPALRFAARAQALAGTPAERLAATELRANSLAAAIRADQALAAFEEALELADELGDAAARSRLRAMALLMSVRYMGAFALKDWRSRVSALARDGFAEVGEDAVTFEAGALLLWRGWGEARRRERERMQRRPEDLPGAKRDAARAVAIAEALGSSLLLAVALEGLTWMSFEEGLCDAVALAQRQLRAAATVADHVEAHESLTTAAICFANGGRFGAARRAAAQGTAQAAGLSPHRALHAAAAEAVALAPTGRFGELLDRTQRIVDLAAAEGDHLCGTGAMGLAGRCLGLFESGDSSLAHALEVMRRSVPPTRWVGWGHPIAELLRPVVGPEETIERIATMGPAAEAWLEIRRLRAEIPLYALAHDWRALERVTARARALAAPACAPALVAFADWGDAVRLVAGGQRAEGLERAQAASGALAAAGERYTAARMLAELLASMGADAPAELSERAAGDLTAMGAHAGAALARSGQAVSR